MLAWRRAAAHTIMTAMTDIIPQLSLPPCILCSSITGNTRFLADALAGATGAPVFPTGHPPLLDHAGTLLLGFWVRRGLPDSRSLRLWQGIRGKRVFFFGTHGTRPGSDHSRQCLAAARRLLQDNGNEVLGGFLCQGRVNPRLVALAGRPGHHPMTPARAARLAEAARHPDGADRQALVRCWDRCRQGLPLPGADLLLHCQPRRGISGPAPARGRCRRRTGRRPLFCLVRRDGTLVLSPRARYPARGGENIMEKIVSRVELSEDPALPGEILNKAESLFVAFQTGDFPYVLPFNHVWLDGRIYIHCALEGRKIDVLRRDGRVGFSTAVDVCIIREKSTTHFRSLCGTGRVSEVTDTEEKRRALDAISLRFDARCPRPTPDAALARVNILRIDVESLTCRHKNGPRRKDKE